MAITTADMKDKLLTVEDTIKRLQKTEPLTNVKIEGDSTIRFHVEADWLHALEAARPTDIVPVVISINGKDHQMTKEAVTQAGANFGLAGSYMKKIPSTFTEGLLNHHYGTMGDTSFNVLSVNDTVAAFTRPTLVPFSNIQLVEKVVEGIHEYGYGDSDIFVDYKFENTLQRTDVRFIVPAFDRIIQNGGMDDIPDGGDDVWYAGVHLSNSLIGKTQTSLEMFLFRWWCTNGATTTLENGGNWSRRSNGQQEDVYEWARESVDEVFAGMDNLFDQVQALTQLNVASNTPEVLREIFSQYEVPVSQREAIMHRLLGMQNLTMYSIMQAITEIANEPDMEDRRRDRLMRIGGALPTTTFDTLKARVWREGHAADETQPNPYEPLVLVAS